MREKRECDAHLDPTSLLGSFKAWCDNCDHGCPMGCSHRRNAVVASSLLDPRCASIMNCFSRFVLSRHVEVK